MRFTQYLEEILATRSDIKLLRTLYKLPTKEFTENELARAAGVGQKTVNRRMPCYVSYGIVSVRKIGRASVCRLNHNHYITKQLGPLFKAEAEARRELARVLRDGFKDDRSLISLVLFGSVASGKESTTSDVDLFVLTTNKPEAHRRLARLREIVARRFGNALSEYVLTPPELRRRRRMLKEIKRGEVLLGKRLGGFHRRAASS